MKKIVREGVAIAYEEAGSGGPEIVLCHAWAGNHTWLAPQLAHLQKRHRVVALDLPGFGVSDKPERPYTIGGYADDIAWACRELGLERPVLIGHSMGGSVVLEAVARHPELASAIVILESLVVAPPGLADGFRPLLEAIKTPAAFAPALTQFMEQLTGPHFDAREKAAMVETTLSNPAHVLISSLTSVLETDSDAAAARCKVPVLYVSSGPWYTDVARFKGLCPTLVTAQLVGCGHYFPLEVPEQLHPILDRFLSIHLR